MSEAVLVALISALAVVVGAAIAAFAPILARMLGRLRAIQAQVQNDHTTNLREELDTRHNETRSWFNLIVSRLAAGDDRFDRIDAAIARLDSEVDALEDTVNPRKETPP